MLKVLPFGLASAYKITSTLVKRWRSKSICAIVYIDDGIGASKSKAQNMVHRDIVVSDLKLVGFVLNIPKSCLEPQQIGKWLGFILDLLKGNFHVPEDKQASVKYAIKNAYPTLSPKSRLSGWLRSLEKKIP